MSNERGSGPGPWGSGEGGPPDQGWYPPQGGGQPADAGMPGGGYPGGPPPGGNPYPPPGGGYPGGPPPGGNPAYPGGNPAYPGGDPSYPGGNPSYPGGPSPADPGQPGGFGFPPGQPWSYNPPPPQSGRGAPVVPIVIGSVVLVIVAALVVAIGLSSGGDGNKNDPPKPPDNAQLAAQAAQKLASVPALRYSGSFSSGGSSMQAQISVTKAGSATGSITVGGDKADLIAVDGATYLKANTAFWRSHGGVTTNPEDYANKWSKSSDTSLDLDIKDVLGPSTIMQRLRGAVPDPAAPTENINGTPAIKISTVDGDYYISKSQPYKVLRIQATGADTYTFDVTELSATEVTTLYTSLRDQVKKLSGALDPSVRFLPSGSLKFSNCGSSGCTLKYTVTSLSLGSGGGSVRAVLKATIRASNKDLGSCSGSRAVPSTKKVDLSCTVTSSGWKNWVSWARRTPGSHRYEARARVVAESVSSTDVSGLLTKIDQEQTGA